MGRGTEKEVRERKEGKPEKKEKRNVATKLSQMGRGQGLRGG